MKLITAEEAANLIKDNDTVGIGGFNGWSCPDAILNAVAKRYDRLGHPAGITAVCGVAPGALSDDGWGLSRLKAEGLLGTVIAGHIGIPLAIGNAIGANRIAGYTLPLGVYGQLLKAASAGRPGVVTKVGLYTFADPRLEGCRANQLAEEQDKKLVSVIELDGEEYLFYRTFPMQVCLIRATCADEDGNISIEDEALITEQREMATAVHNQGGIVIVQVKRIVKRGSIEARNVILHKHFVDYVVVSAPELHPQGYDRPNDFRPELLGKVKVPSSNIEPMPFSVRKVIARRAALELKRGMLVNLGVGMPDGIANVANEEGVAEEITLSIEGGTIGGVPVGGIGLGASVNPEAIYPITDIFDAYDGGGLDIAFLGLAEVDQKGNVNVSKFSGRCTGPGGFIDITQNTKKICFIGAFSSGKDEVALQEGSVSIKPSSGTCKFKKEVEQITFSAKYATQAGQRVLYITERAVFQLTEKGLLLIEVAPGVDVERDVLSQMEFPVETASDMKVMDERIFRSEKMKLEI